MSGAVTGPNHPVIDNSFAYPYGTTEQFPQMEDSDLNELTNSAHYYMECSNKGTCDRTSGECSCFDGYEGVACQRASCPGSPICSGHGVCMSAKQLAVDDNSNTYALWDKDVTMGCKCDAGYSGPSCAIKTCKVGVDPLYLDDSATVKYATYDFATLTTAPGAAASESAGRYYTNDGVLLNDGTATGGRGHWAIRFFDANGEDWVTSPIVAGASCTSVVSALEALPNNVVPPGNTYCTRSWNINNLDNDWSTTGGLGSATGGTLYDAQHPSTSAHPYKINYRMSIWDAYAASTASENVGEGGIDDAKVFYPGSFSHKAAVSAVVAAASASMIFTTAASNYEIGMLLTKVAADGLTLTMGVVSVVNPSTTGTTTTYSITFVGTNTQLDSSDAVVGQTPTVSGIAYQAATTTSVTTTTPGFVAGMTITIGNLASVLIPRELTSVTKTTAGGVTYYTLKYSGSLSTTSAVGDKIAGFSSYVLGGTAYSNSGSPTTVAISGAVGFSTNMNFFGPSGSGSTFTGQASAIVYKPSVTRTATWLTSSTTLTVTSNAGIEPGMSVAASGINSGQYVVSVAGTSVVISANPDVAAATSTSVTFGAVTVATIPSMTTQIPYGTVISGTTPAFSVAGAATVAGINRANYNSLIVPTTQNTAVSSQTDYCGYISNAYYVGFSDTTNVKDGRNIGLATSNGAIAVSGNSFTTTTSGAQSASFTLPLDSVAWITPGMGVSGTGGIAADTTVVSVSASSIQLSKATTGVVSGTITFTLSSTVATTTLIITEVNQGIVTTGMFVTPLSGGTGFTISCGPTGNLAIVMQSSSVLTSIWANANSNTAICTMSSPQVIASGTVLFAQNSLVEFTGYYTASNGRMTITNVASGPVVSGMMVTRLDGVALVAAVTLNCPKPIPKGGSGECYFYSYSPAELYTTNDASGILGTSTAPVTFVASTLFGSSATAPSALCLFNFDGAASGITSYGSGNSIFFYPKLDGDKYEVPRAALSGYIYRIKFYGNPGALRAPEIVTHLDGKRNSLMSVNYLGLPSKKYRVITKVWTDGQQGEFNDYFADHCDGVQVTISNLGVYTGAAGDFFNSVSSPEQNQFSGAKFYLDSLTSTEKMLLKVCLGDADFDTKNNVGVYNWDTGSSSYPHLIKLVRSVTTYTDGGYYAAIYYVETDNFDGLGSGGTFYLLNPFSPPDAFATDSYEVYTTKGVFAQASSTVGAYFGFGSKTIYTVNPYDDPQSSFYDPSNTARYKGTKLATGTTSSKSSTITVTAAFTPVVGMTVTGQGLSPNTIVTAVGGSASTYTVTVSPPVVTSDGSVLQLQFGYDYSGGDLSCETGLSDTLKWKFWNSNTIQTSQVTYPSTYVCLNNSDIITFLNPGLPAMNPPHINLYTVKRLHKSVPRLSEWARWGYFKAGTSSLYGQAYDGGQDMKYMTSTITLDHATNWGVSVGGAKQKLASVTSNNQFFIYKFYPAPVSTYNYVAPCSNRGTCDTTTGLCQCFPGYTSDDCHVQSSLSL